jgi:hypothetical protein
MADIGGFRDPRSEQLMSSSDKSEPAPPPNIEASPSPAPAEEDGPKLRLRIRQQEILAELGVLALQHTSLPELLDSAVRMAAEGLQSDLCKILEYIPAENRLLLRAGVGWDPGLVGVASVGADLASPRVMHCTRAIRSFQIIWKTRSASGRQSCCEHLVCGGLST